MGAYRAYRVHIEPIEGDRGLEHLDLFTLGLALVLVHFSLVHSHLFIFYIFNFYLLSLFSMRFFDFF